MHAYFPRAVSFLEIGCGTGFVLSGIHRRFPHHTLAGCEIFMEGLGFARARCPDVDLFQIDARRVPFDDEFDVVGAFDVLEHIEEDQTVLCQMFRAVKAGGGLLLTVPQHRFLWSAIDDYSFHRRRYARNELVSKVQRAGFRIRRVTSFVTLLLPLLLVSRLRRSGKSVALDPVAELRIHPLLNGALEEVLDFERRCIQMGVSFPFGGSLLLVAQKD